MAYDGWAWLMQVAQALPDTIVTKQVEVDLDCSRRSPQLRADCRHRPARADSRSRSGGVNFRKSYAKISDMLDRIYATSIRSCATRAHRGQRELHPTSVRVDVRR